MLNVPSMVYNSVSKNEITNYREKLFEQWVQQVVNPVRDEEYNDSVVRSLVIDSWKRSKSYDELDPMHHGSIKSVSDAELKVLVEMSNLHQIAKPILEDAYREYSNTNCLLMLSDENGVVFESLSPKDTYKLAEKTNAVKGSDWSERWAGTNSIGTSIILKQPVQIFSTEHFAYGCHDWVCSSAPIINPVTYELKGTITLAVPTEHITPLSMMETIKLANLIERRFFQYYYKAHEKMHSIYFDSVRNAKGNIVLLLDANGKINRMNNDIPVNEVEQFIAESHYWSRDEIQEWEDVIHVSVTKHNVKVKKIYWEGQVIGAIVTLEKKNNVKKTEKIYTAKYSFQNLVGNSNNFRKIIEIAERSAMSDSNILITGESGTGKELVANAIHNASDRAEYPFIAVNSAAIPRELIASELFGYVPGAFTGADPKGRKGKFELAHKGTIFLDEIGDMPLELQVQLLRVIQEREVYKIGDSKPIPIDVRIIAATNKDLLKEVNKGNFRKDLYYRLNVIPIELPSLKLRKEDIPIIIRDTLETLFVEKKLHVFDITDDALQVLQSYSWPGNIRELKNVIEYAANYTEDGIIRKEHLPKQIRSKVENTLSLITTRLNPVQQAELDWIVSTLKLHDYNIVKATEELGMSRSTIYRKLKQYGYDLNEMK